MDPDRGAKRLRLLAPLLALLTLAVYLPVARNEFVTLDDNLEIFDNPEVRKGLTWETAWWSIRSTENSNWHPLTRLSHLADVSAFGLWAGGHHLVSVLWHAAAAVLLLATLRGMTGALWRSLAVASLFALHPLHVESVAWAAERKDVLSAFLGLLAVRAHLGYARRPTAARAAAVAALLALGLAAKPMLVTLPFLLLVLDWWPLGRWSPLGVRAPSGTLPLGRLLREKLPLFALAAASSALTLAVQRSGGAVQSLALYPLGLRLENAAVSFLTYLGKAAWPASLAVLYPYPRAIPAATAAGAAVLLLAATLLALRAARRRPWVPAGWLWYLGTLVPVIGVVQVGDQALADRYSYLPLVGVFILVAWSAGAVFPSRAALRALACAALASALLALALLTRRQVGLWKDTLTLYEHTLAVTGDNPLIEYNLANALRGRGRLTEAIEHYARAARLRPEPALLNNLGAALSDVGRPEEALGHLREAVRLRPESPDFRWNLALALRRAGRHAEATTHEREYERLSGRR